ncbi:putative signal transducing protein [Capnocytophaga gingivalis]
MKTELKKLYEGDIPTVTMLVGALEEVGITPIVKDPMASAAIAGYGALGSDQQVYVFQDQWEKASEILSELNLSQE